MAAEVAAGAIIAEEVVSTTAQGAAATYAVAKPTMPLKATFNRIATAQDDQTSLSLVRSHSTVSVVGGKAFVFGGDLAGGKVASNEIHSINLEPSEKPDYEYAAFGAVADSGESRVPSGRSRHAACAFNVCVAIFGGCDESGKLVDSDATIWLYNTAKSAWETLVAAEPSRAAPSQRTDARLFDCSNNLVLYGGYNADGQPLTDVWHFNYVTREWKALPDAPVSTTNAALAGHTLYLISASDSMSSAVHHLDLRDPDAATAAWSTTSFPTNPLAPGPRARTGGGLVPVSTGYGRNYLVYFFGARQNPVTSETKAPDETTDATQWGDVWTYQIPSSEPEIKPTLSLSDAVKPARIKDAIRSSLGFDSGQHSWAEVEVVPPGDLGELGDGKVHPGPRGYFGCDVMKDGRSVVFWGGINAKGEKEGDGWIIHLS